MKNHKGGKRAYIRSSKAYYNSVVLTTRIMIGIYDSEGGMSGEFQIEWIDLGKAYAQLQVFEDTWSCLWEFRDLLEKMAEIDGQAIQEPEFCKLLDNLGILDITEYEKGCPKNRIE